MAPGRPHVSSFSLSSLLPIARLYRPFFSLSFPESAGIFGTLKKPRWHTVPLPPASPRVAPLLLLLLLFHVSPTSPLSRSPALFTRTLTRERAWKGAPGTKGIASGKPARVHVPGTRVSRKSAPRNREKGVLTKRVLCNFDEMTYFYLRKV